MVVVVVVVEWEVHKVTGDSSAEPWRTAERKAWTTKKHEKNADSWRYSLKIILEKIIMDYV